MSAKDVQLPAPRPVGGLSVEEAIRLRRSVRSFAPVPLSMVELSQLLWAAQGVTGTEVDLRAAPSAGALHPIKIVAAAGPECVAGLGGGVYRYAPEVHRLEMASPRDARGDLASAALEQSFVAEAPLVLVIAASYRITTVKYAERGVRYVHFEAGHVAENVLLQAVGLGVAAVVVGAFVDLRVARAASLAPHEQPLLLVPVGHAR